jgi:thiamine-phosphate pyrophosphorylase
MKLPRLYAIADVEMLLSRGIALRTYIEELRDAGVKLLQYRDKLAGDEEVLRNAEMIAEVFRGVDATLVMNDSPELARRAGWNAVHLGQGDAAIADARAMLPRGVMLGCSTHNEDQVVVADTAGADYIAIGPVFVTSTKRNAEPVVGLEGVRRARALTSRPLVAIGGITVENAASVIDAGADSVAVIGALLDLSASPAEMVRRFLEAMPARR